MKRDADNGRDAKKEPDAGSGRSRRHRGQMVQAARGGYQNLAEGSEDSATSKKLEMNLTNVARASLGELEKDYVRHLRRRELRRWQQGEALFDEARALLPPNLEAAVAWVNGPPACAWKPESPSSRRKPSSPSTPSSRERPRR